MMEFMLDTNICIYIAHRKAPIVVSRFAELAHGDACISLVTYAELCWGAYNSNAKAAALAKLDEFIAGAPVLPMRENVGPVYGEIRHYLKRKGTPIGNNDLWIAAHALAENLTIITNNDREFKRIPKLKVENWTK